MSLNLFDRYNEVRELSCALVAPLTEADAQVQSMEDASPTKWHLAHTTWFFETLLLLPYCKGYRPYNEHYQYLFNSYYNGIGKQYLRSARGMLSRPTLKEVMDYRRHVDQCMLSLIDNCEDEHCLWLVNLGLNHEQQHQELILTDIKHAFHQNPIFPSYLETSGDTQPAQTLSWVNFEEGLYEIGTNETHFAFDNESPKHKVLLQGFSLSNRLVTNREYVEFIDDQGYQTPQLWLSDGWSYIQNNGLSLPLYWRRNERGEYNQFTLSGMQPLPLDEPLVHVNYFEADAFARWKGARLPTEFEWEAAAKPLTIDGAFLTLELLRPTTCQGNGLIQMFGQCWQWTSSSYSAYPNYQPFPGAVGEYNGKFMCGQQVLRGGSCATPRSSFRHTYRNFFYPHQSWQFSGIRLAK